VVSLGHIDNEERRNCNMADCGCGRSPTGQCIGWHNLSEEEYQQKLKEHQEKEAENNNDANE